MSQLCCIATCKLKSARQGISHSVLWIRLIMLLVVVCKSSAVVTAYSGLTTAPLWLSCLQNVAQQTLWSLTTWLKCFSFLLFTTFTKSVSVPMCSRMRCFGIFCAQCSSVPVHVKCRWLFDITRSIVLFVVNLHTKFQVCSFSGSRDTEGSQNLNVGKGKGKGKREFV